MENQKDKPLKLRVKLKPQQPNQEEINCAKCPKKFKTQKALHGHMRIHSKRNGQVIQPPSTSHNSDSLNEPGPVEPEPKTTSEPELLSSAVKGWKATGKRSKKQRMRTKHNDSSALAASTPSSFSHHDEAAEAAETLLLLANGRGKEEEHKASASASASTSFSHRAEEDVEAADTLLLMAHGRVRESTYQKAADNKIAINGKQLDEDEIYYLQHELGLSIPVSSGSIFHDDCSL